MYFLKEAHLIPSSNLRDQFCKYLGVYMKCQGLNQGLLYARCRGPKLPGLQGYML